MFEKGKREQRHDKEDATFNKMLLWLAGAVVVELVILLLDQIYVNRLLGTGGMVAMMYFFRVFMVLGVVLVAAGIAWGVMNAKKGKGVALPCACTAAAAVLWAASVLAHFLSDVGLSIAMILPAVAAVLIVVFFLYQRVFFFNAMLAGGGLVALWLYRRYYLEHPTMITAFFVAGFVVLAAALVLSFVLRGGDGKLGGLRVVPAGTGYVLTWITCAATAAAMALALVLGVTAAYYLLFILIGWLFVQAVFFTVKLM